MDGKGKSSLNFHEIIDMSDRPDLLDGEKNGPFEELGNLS